MAYALEILFKMALHLDGNPVLQEILFLGKEFGRNVPNALFGILTIRCTAKIQAGVKKTVAAFGAFAGWIVLKELHLISAFGAFDFENSPRLPVLAVLSRTFHGRSPFNCRLNIDGLVKSPTSALCCIS
jgi:hypothetical protein